jgi:6-phosphogluconolactonase
MVYELNESHFEHSLSLTGEIVVEPSDDLLFDRLGADLTDAALKALRDRGVFHLALSGGSTPEPFYMRLCTDPRFRAIPWGSTHIWLVDERRVPADDDRLNFRMIKSVLVDHIPIRTRQVHPMPVMEENAAELYEAELRSIVPDGRLDFILLGMGDDGHTASLFPGSRGLQENSSWIAANDGPGVTPPPRLTMTYPLINAGRELAVLATKAKKAPMLRSIHDQLASAGPDIQKYPITGVNPAAGTLTWYLDAAAAGAKEA